jgi:hypothetical protein
LNAGGDAEVEGLPVLALDAALTDPVDVLLTTRPPGSRFAGRRRRSGPAFPTSSGTPSTCEPRMKKVS